MYERSSPPPPPPEDKDVDVVVFPSVHISMHEHAARRGKRLRSVIIFFWCNELSFLEESTV